MMKTIWAFIQRLSKPPSHPDPQQNRLARVLHYTLLIGIFLAGSYCLLAWTTTKGPFSVVIGGVATAVYTLLFIILRSGRIRFVSVALVLSSYLALMISLFVNGGLRDEAGLVLISLLALTGFFFGKRGMLILGITTIILFIVLFATERAGILVENEHLFPVGWDELLLAVLAVIITTIILRQLSNQIVASTEQIRQQAQALQEKNEALLLTQHALIAAKEEAERANAAKSAFLSRLSHDLRTPLNSIMGFTNVLLDDPALSPKDRTDWLRRIQTNGEYMQRMIDDLLDLSRIEAGKLQLYPVQIPLTAFLMEVVVLIQMEVQQKSFQFVYQFDKALPDFVYTDETRLRQILLNLLGNAVKFTPKGSITFRVRPLPATSSHQPVCFEVIDTGIGIPQADLERIFEPFEQSGSEAQRAQRKKGTGLGLAISRQLVNLLGGELQVESKIGKGSRFWFTVPFPLDKTKVN
ncbi:MAG: ATP-binding protein [Anaerolineae bacterium]